MADLIALKATSEEGDTMMRNAMLDALISDFLTDEAQRPAELEINEKILIRKADQILMNSICKIDR